MGSFARKRPFVVTKLNQLVRLVQESHAQPITGEVRELEVVGKVRRG